METWFGESIEQQFNTFSTSHITGLFLFFIISIALIILIKKFSTNPKSLEMIRWVLFGILILSELSYQVWAVVNNTWSIRDRGPLHLCGIASITVTFALLLKKEKLIQLSFFIGIIPAFLALITPDIPYDFQHFRFWKFFIHHMAIVWGSIFLVLTTNTKIHVQSFISSYVFLVLYAIVIGFIVNPLLHSNFLYLANTPASTMLRLFGEGAWYYINLGLTTLLLFFIQLRVYLYWKKRKDN
ncbi:YwaF family protein [Aquibacillus rhizosphaerae]|uniref:TIGR02206 family membrane protein n=1 Tax=Aquibacillus rhizosphaerae TaxID=3051431 RepID=A0ABT7L795_9BACI|nr:TIGR02206 family membrane protein [Aquibacillus sp. LR5S19]MDL4841711.1 TIGR02206 family membrane protein [Aquibacillus sp. LR5S19]